MIDLDTEICSSFESSSSREWLETNGTGSYASSSVSGANTRRYHGLLVAATRPPLGRMVLLSKFEETVMVGGERYEISCNQYPGSVHPDGCKYLTGFRLEPFPVWTYEVAGYVIERKLFMVYGEDTTVISWSVKDRKKRDKTQIMLELKPLLAFRDHHHLRHEDTAFERDYTVEEGLVSIRPYAEMPTLYLAHNAKGIEKQGYWYHDFEYAIERERGFDYHEDLFQPFSMTFDLSAEAVVIASTLRPQTADIKALEDAEIKRRAGLVVRAGKNDESLWPLILAADQFIVARG